MIKIFKFILAFLLIEGVFAPLQNAYCHVDTLYKLEFSGNQLREYKVIQRNIDNENRLEILKNNEKLYSVHVPNGEEVKNFVIDSITETDKGFKILYLYGGGRYIYHGKLFFEYEDNDFYLKRAEKEHIELENFPKEPNETIYFSPAIPLIFFDFEDNIINIEESRLWIDSVICRADNDYCTFVDTTSPRKATPLILNEYVKEHYPPYSTRNQIFEIKTDSFIIYVVRYKFGEFYHGGTEEYHLWLYKPDKGLSPQPFVLNGQWAADNEDGFETKIMKYPLVQAKGNTIIARERKHNGTYNAVMRYTLTYDENLQFSLQNFIEETSLITIDGKTNVFIQRECNGDKVDSYLVSDGKSSFIGSYTVSNDNINNIVVSNKEYSNFIVTSFPEGHEGYMEQISKQKKQTPFPKR